MDSSKNQSDCQIDWEDVLNFLHKKRRLATKFEMSFNKRKQELDVS